MINEQTEKMTLNVNHIDLGKIDILVENGFFSNRSDFIRAAIRDELSKNESFINTTIEKKEFAIGIAYFGAEDFEKAIEDNHILDVNYIGLLVIKKDVTLEMIKKSVKRMNVKGTLIAPKEIKDYLKSIQ
ncbi:hypothetical protein [Alkalibacterium iburiense]|uniref:hypothetical protein n=1 Tax=Alkalibacterium iburiense TaxID=290589 RepID=UPI0031D2F10C